MYFPIPASIGQIVQHEGCFVIHQVAHDLPVSLIGAPLAFPQQDVTRMPIDGCCIHLRTAAQKL
jgi:hypothetical protein